MTSTPQQIASLVSANPDLEQQMRDDPARTLKVMAAMPLATDVWIYRCVVGGLTFAMVAAIIGAMSLSAFDKKVPDSVIALGSAALGALAILLQPQRQL